MNTFSLLDYESDEEFREEQKEQHFIINVCVNHSGELQKFTKSFDYSIFDNSNTNLVMTWETFDKLPYIINHTDRFFIIDERERWEEDVNYIKSFAELMDFHVDNKGREWRILVEDLHVLESVVTSIPESMSTIEYFEV